MPNTVLDSLAKKKNVIIIRSNNTGKGKNNVYLLLRTTKRTNMVIKTITENTKG